MRSFAGETKYWEHKFEGYNLSPQWGESTETLKAREANWLQASRMVGENLVFVSKDSPKESLGRKGYKTLEVPESIVMTANTYKLLTPEKVMDADEREGRMIVDATADAVACAEFVWAEIVKAGMNNGKDMPGIKCFRSIMDGGSVRAGFHRDGIVYVNENLASGQNVELRQTVLEEMAHYVTGATDESRDLQDWAFGFAMRCMMVHRGELVAGV